MKSASPRRPTIADVARMAKVSTATVSRTLQSPEVVSERTREAVLAAVRQTGYRANSVAKMLRQNRSRAILVLLPDIANPFFSEILSGVDEVATAAEYTIFIGNTCGGSEIRTRALMESLWNGRADGGLLLNGELPEFDHNISSVPLVSISEIVPEASIPHVGTDNVIAAMDATNHLISQGHSRIAHVSGPSGNSLSKDRQHGYERAMIDAGFEDHIQVIEGGFALDDGRVAVGTLLNSGRDTTALFCANDEAAMGAIAELNEAGLIVPRDISVMGFDDISFAQVFSPALSTIRQSRSEIGRKAMTLLLEELDGAGSEPKTIHIPHKVVQRASTARPKV